MISAVKSHWLTTQEACQEFGFNETRLASWREYCPLLGRKIRYCYATEQLNTFLHCRKDLERIAKALFETPSEEFTDDAGEKWVSVDTAAQVPFLFPHYQIEKWSDEKKNCLLLDVDNPRRLRKQLVPIKRGEISFREVYYYHKGDLRTIRNNLNAGRVISKVYGPGWTKEELKAKFHVGQRTLRKHLDAPGWSWFEVRVIDVESTVQPSSKLSPKAAHRVRVYSPVKVKELMEERAEIKKASESPDKETLSERESIAKYPEEIGDGDFVVWRKQCIFTGAALICKLVPVPGGVPEWRASAQKVKEIVEKIREHRDKKQWDDEKRGACLPSWIATETHGISASELQDYKDKPSRNLGGAKFDAIKVFWPRKKSSRGGMAWVYPERQIQQFVEAKKQAVKRREDAEAFLRDLLANGSVKSADVKALASSKAVTIALLREAAKRMGVLFREIGRAGPTVWYLEGQDPLKPQTIAFAKPSLKPDESPRLGEQENQSATNARAIANGAAVDSPRAEDEQQAVGRGKGRPVGSIDKRIADRNDKMKKDWNAGSFATIKALARAHGVSRSRASKIINGAD